VRSPGQISRMEVDLAAQQDENAGCYGKERHDNSQTAHRDESGQTCENKPDG